MGPQHCLVWFRIIVIFDFKFSIEKEGGKTHTRSQFSVTGSVEQVIATLVDCFAKCFREKSPCYVYGPLFSYSFYILGPHTQIVIWASLVMDIIGGFLFESYLWDIK
jgi:hypothetical protein